MIVNLQKTPLNSVADLVIHAKCDDVMTMLMERLGIAIPSFRLARHIRITTSWGTGASKTKPSGASGAGAPGAGVCLLCWLW